MAKKKSAKKVAPKRVPVPPPRPSLSSDFVSMDALYQAFRKAKVDVFYERSQPLSKDFCEYERNLHANLTALQEALTRPDTDWFNSIDFIGEYGFIPKGLEIHGPDGHQDSDAHFSVSNPDDAWDVMLESLNGNQPTAEFRPVAIFTVNMYVVCALWVNLVGHMFDACLDSSARGSRLRRLRKTSEGPGSGEYHLTAPGSFKPYIHGYKAWRGKGLRAIRKELAEDRKVVAITMDLRAFYHSIDPRFILRPDFLKASRFSRVNRRDLTVEETAFTAQIVDAFVVWGRSLPHLDHQEPPGLPVGASAPRIIANVLLAEFDRRVQSALDPVYYSRYVDDIFLVLRDNGRMRTADHVLQHLQKRLSRVLQWNEDKSSLVLTFTYSGGCQLLFQKKKQRIFLLAGEIGADLLDTIQNQIDEVSSEWRLLPDLTSLEKSPAAKVLTASRSATERADTLRKADQLSLKRLSFSVMLRHYDILAHDLPAAEWKRERENFYRFVERHVLTPLRILDLNDYLPRLLGIAISCEDWGIAKRLLKRIENAITKLRDNVSLGHPKQTDAQWHGYLRHMQRALNETVYRSAPFEYDGKASCASVKAILSAITKLDHSAVSDDTDISVLSRELFWIDLGRFPFKHALLGYVSLPSQIGWGDFDNLPESQSKRLNDIRDFLRESGNESIDPRPLLFPTRPFSPREVTEVDKENKSVWNLERLRKYVSALRGTWVKPLSEESTSINSEATSCIQVIGEKTRNTSPRIAITSFLTEDASWANAAKGTPDLSVERYKRLVRLANAIVRMPRRDRADYVVFPELSIPRRWLPGLAGLFVKEGVSLITGVEYRRVPPEPATQVVNEAYLLLLDDRLGYPSWCVVRQQKGVPAHKERDELRAKFGLSLAATSSKDKPKPIYRHFGHDFGVLICSELTDISFRQEMRGEVDTLFVLSWNQDLESFGAMVEAAVLDVHCYMVLVNNRKYGDSRVRTPSKKNWMRDLVRIKGGLDDYFVVTDLDVMSLRNFQSYHEPPLGDDAAFKPTPEGFTIAKRRKQTPGGGS
jgi:hypothetical protein